MARSWIIVLVMLLFGCASVQNNTVVVGEAIVSYYDPSRALSADDEIATDDFNHYQRPIREIAEELGVQFVQTGDTRIVLNGTGFDRRRAPAFLGQILTKPDALPKILPGVQTDVDIACLAAEYFQRGSARYGCPGAASPLGRGAAPHNSPLQPTATASPSS